jgi:5-methylthioadenosine/S-adenosylhomocysteine deaminase
MSEVDMLIAGAYVATMDTAGTEISRGSVAIKGNRITDILGPEAALPVARRVINGDSKLVLPGFINAHSHTVLSGLRGLTEDLPGEVSLYRHLLPFRARMTPQAAYRLARLGALEALRFGCTTVVDLYWHEEMVAQAFTEIGIRGVLGESISEVDLLGVADGVYRFDRAEGKRRLKAAEDLILRHHGKGLIRCLVAPHAPDDCSPDLLKECSNLARQYGLPVAMHVSQSRGEVKRLREWYGKGPIELLDSLGLLGPRLMAGHCIFLTDEEIQLLARSDTWVVHLPMINAKRGYAAPTPRMLEIGVNITIGSDNMTQDMVMSARTAMIVARMQAASGTLMSPREVLRMATLHAARALGVDNEVGSIEVGKLADLVLVDLRKPHLWPTSDPVATFVHWGLASDVDTVIVDGQVLVEQGHLTRAMEPTVLEEAQIAAQECWAITPRPVAK